MRSDEFRLKKTERYERFARYDRLNRVMSASRVERRETGFLKKPLTNAGNFNIIYLFSMTLTERDPRGTVGREAAFRCEPLSVTRDRSLPSRKEESGTAQPSGE